MKQKAKKNLKKQNTSLMYVSVKDNNIERALREFKKRVKNSNLLKELREREYFEKKSLKKRKMKKTRILRALKNCKSDSFKTDSVLSFKDEKGKEYFLAEQPHYMNIITNSINVILNRTFNIIDDVKLKKKILKGLNDDKE